MRVVHLSTQHDSLDMHIFHKECRTLAAAGHQVHLLAGKTLSTPLDGVQIHALAKSIKSPRWLRIADRLRAIFQQAKALRAAVYHFHDPELIPVGLLLKRTGARVVYDVHEDSPREAQTLNKDRPLRGRMLSFTWSLFECLGRRSFDAFVCATPTIARKFPRQRTVVVRNYPGAEELSLNDAEVFGRRDIAYVGGITRIRGGVEMVRAMEHVQPSSVRLHLAGPIHPAEFRSELEMLPGWRRVVYRGVLDRRGVKQLLDATRIGLVVLQREQIFMESLPVKLFEYMAAGLAIVASDFPQWRDIVSGAGCGIVANPQSPEAIAAAIQFLLDRPVQAAAMGASGRAAALQHYNWQAEGQKLLNCYQALRSKKQVEVDAA